MHTPFIYYIALIIIFLVVNTTIFYIIIKFANVVNRF